MDIENRRITIAKRDVNAVLLQLVVFVGSALECLARMGVKRSEADISGEWRQVKLGFFR